MKKLLLLLLLITPSLYALDCSIEAGMQDKNLMISYLKADDFGNMFVEIGVYQDVSLLTLYGIYRNEMDKDMNTFFFNPRQDYFTIGATANIGSFIINIEHQCLHPTHLWRDEEHGIYGGYSQISIKYSSK